MDYKRYGLNANPYEAEKPTLEENRWLPAIHSLDEQVICSRLATALAKGKPVSYVIIGTSGSGRSAAAFYLMALYEKLLNHVDVCSTLSGITTEM